MGFDVKEELKFLDRFEREVSTGMTDVCIGTARKALVVAQNAVPNLQLSRGYATDALKLSGYVISKRGSGYNAAIRKAQAKNDRIAERGQIKEQFDIHSIVDLNNREYAVAVLDFPLTYADLIQKGFYHVLAERHIVGVDFISTAENAVNDDFISAMNTVLFSALSGQRRLRLPGF